ncbi:carbohydrate-binding protein [Corynebacterium simulans]|uniref:carbohydrate-binding protein n=1 Tax=Corynebacterium simulans TaxID=146827 RepID=UPI000AB6BD06|nr:carbohydrate-binding protein [Corynebacterium simulans]
MSVHFGGKKVKELYYGGKKVKEAWYGGQKVYGAAGGRIFGKWTTNFNYVVGDRVAHRGIMYECIEAHTSDRGDYPSSATNQPGYGWDQYTFWKQIGYAYEFGF